MGERGGGGISSGNCWLSGLTQSLLLTQMKFESQVQFNSNIHLLLLLLSNFLLVDK